MNKRQLLAGTAAAVLTFGSAAAAVALNVGASSSQDTSPAGKLAAVESVATTAPPVTPSTIYVDVTVPDLPPVTAAADTSGQSAPAGSTGASSATGSPRTSAPRATARADEPESRHEQESEHEGGGDDD